MHRPMRILVLLLGYSTQSLAVGALALFLPLIREDVDISYAESGAIALASTLAYSAMQVPAGYLGDRFGVRRVLLTGLVGLNVMTAMIAFCNSYSMLLADQVVLGLFRGVIFATGLAVVTGEFTPERRATAMSCLFASGFVAMAALNTFGPFAVAASGWRGATIMLGVVGLGLVAILWQFGPRSKTASVKVESVLMSVGKLVRQPVVWLVAFVQFARLAVASSFSFWLPTYLTERMDLSLGVAGTVVAAGSIISLTAGLSGAIVSDRVGRPLLVPTASLALLCASFLMLAMAGSPLVIVALVCVLAFLMHAYTGPLFEVALRSTRGVDPKMINGFGNLWANLGALTFVYLTGLTREMTGGFGVAWAVIAMLCACALAATSVIGRVIGRDNAGKLRPQA